MHLVIKLFSALLLFSVLITFMFILANLGGFVLGYTMMTLGVAIMSYLIIDTLYEMRNKKKKN